jgi:hypothetical protein
MKKTILGLAIFAISVASCKKDDEIKTLPLTKENVAGSYKLTGVETKIGTQRSNVTDTWFEFVGSCSQDDVTNYNVAGTYAINDLGTVCDPSNDYAGVWDVANPTTLSKDGTLFPVESFNVNELKLVIEDASISGEYIFTYTRQ